MESLISVLMEKVSCIYPPRVPNYVKHVSLFNALLNNVNVPFNYVQGTRGGYIHEVSVVLMVIVITLQSQFASLAQKSARKCSASRHECRWMFTENKADETFHVTYTNLYSMAGRRDIDRTYNANVSLNGDSFS